MNKLKRILQRNKKEVIATLVFILCLGIFSISHAFAAVEPVRSIVIQSENADFASGEEGSWQVTKSGYWTNYGEAEVSLDVDTSLMINNQYTDIIFVLDISGSMSGDKLDRVKNDSKELIQSLLSNQNNRAALITFDTESRIVSELTNDEEHLINEIDNLEVTGSTNYYQALVNVDNILKDYQKENNKEVIVLFLTDGYPNEDTPNQITQYNYLKSMYPYITVNGIQYEMGDAILNPIKEISDNQFIADMDTLNNVLFDAIVAPVTYDEYQIIDYIDNENFTLESINDINVTNGEVELTEEDGQQKITWTLDNLKSGNEENLTMKLKLKKELIGQGGIYPTNESTEVISKIEKQEEDVTTTNTPILADNYKVIYDGNVPDGSTVTNVPSNANYSVYSTIEISNQAPECEGYEFKGWHITTNGVTRVGKDYFIMPESDVIIKAEWSKVGITKSMNGTVSTMGEPIMKEYKLGMYGDPNGEPTMDITTTDYHSFEYRPKITSIVTKDNIDIPSTAIEYWDVSSAGDGSVIAYIEDDGRGAGTYKVTIGGNKKIIANPNSEGVFATFPLLETIDLTYLDTSRVTNMGGKYVVTENYVEEYLGMFSSNASLQNIIFGDSWDTSNVTNMNEMFSRCEGLISLDVSNFNTSQVTDMSGMFSRCRSLTNLDVSYFDTSQVTGMSGMFSGCSSLTNLDVSYFDTSQVTNMSGMFSSCSSLTNLDVSYFDTSQVTDMDSMFSGCESLTSLDLSNFDTSQVKNMREMFSWCEGLISLDVSNFNTSQVTDMSGMFSRCRSLTSLDLSSFDTIQVTDMSDMFYYCRSLLSLDLSNFNTSKVTNMSSMFSMNNISSSTSSNTKLTNIIFGDNWNTSQVTDMSYMFFGSDALTSLDLSRFDTSKVTNMNYMFSGCNKLTNLNLSSFDTSQVTDMSDMFSGCNKLTNLNLSSFDTSQVTDMSDMFNRCSSLTSLDLSSFDTSQVTNMSDMFSGCESLISITFGPGWTNEKITDMSYMFSGLTKLENISFNEFKTSNVTNMSDMFYNCPGLKSLDLSSFDTSQVTDMDSMFSGCESLTSLDLSSFDTSQVNNMGMMFSGCDALTNLDLSNFDTSQVTDMSYMFNRCSSLTSLDVSNFNTSQVTDMSGIFSNCSSLTNLDLSNFDTSQVTDMSGMFQDCNNLIILNLSNFNTSNVVDMTYMFLRCNNLISLDLSSFDTSKVTDIMGMFNGCSSLTNLDMRNAVFNATDYLPMFRAVPNGISIIVKDETAKIWIETRLSESGKTGTVTIAST